MAAPGLLCVRAFSTRGRRGSSLVWRSGFPSQSLLLWSLGPRCTSISRCGTWASLPRGLWDLPGTGTEPVSLASAGEFLTTGPPEKVSPLSIVLVSQPDRMFAVICAPSTQFTLNSYLNRSLFELALHLLLLLFLLSVAKSLSFLLSVAKSRSALCNPWTVACPASLSFTVSQCLLKFRSLELVMLANPLILCCLIVLPKVFPSMRAFFPMNWLFTSGGQSTRASTSAAVLPMNIQG